MTNRNRNRNVFLIIRKLGIIWNCYQGGGMVICPAKGNTTTRKYNNYLVNQKYHKMRKIRW